MRAFIIRPFGCKADIDFDRVERELIDKALDALGVAGRTCGEIVAQGNIRTDMFERLLTADLVIADVSIHNANVFYELGIRHALRRRCTLLLRCSGDSYPFDLQTDRYLTYDKDQPAAALPNLIDALKRTIAAERSDSPVFQLLPELAEQDRARLLAAPRTFREEVERAAAADQRGDLALLAAEAKGFVWESQGLRLVGLAQKDLKDYVRAIATWEAIRKDDPLNLEANLQLGTLYERQGDLVRSDQAVRNVLSQREAPARLRAEAHALLGRNAKTRWRDVWSKAGLTLAERQAAALRSPRLQESYHSYEHGFATDLNHPYSGLNALAMLTVMTELAAAQPAVRIAAANADSTEEARQVLEHHRRHRTRLAGAVDLSIQATLDRLDQKIQGGGAPDPAVVEERMWAMISAADLCMLTATHPDRVAAAYLAALEGVPGFAFDSARQQLRLYQELGILTANLQAALAIAGNPPAAAAEPPQAVAGAAAAPPRTLLFTGHRIDDPDRPTPRFPAAKERSAREALRGKIAAELAAPGGVALGIAGGASGGDILFHELCDDLGIPTQLYLALPDAQFIAESVAPADADWVRRFRRVAASRPKRELATAQELPPWLAEKADYNFWERNNLWMLHNALALGRPVTLIALWNGKTGDGPGGTGHLVESARKLGADVVRIDPDTLSA